MIIKQFVTMKEILEPVVLHYVSYVIVRSYYMIHDMIQQLREVTQISSHSHVGGALLKNVN